MSAATAKKMPVPGVSSRGGTPDPAGSSPARTRSATPTSSGGGGGAGSGASSSQTPGRTRSLRQSGSISARGAARQSPLSSNTSLANGVSTGGGGGGGTGGGEAPAAAGVSTADDDARAETAARLQDLQDRLAAVESERAQMAKQGDVLQARLDEATRESARMEEKVHETEEQLEGLRLERRDAARQMREMEAIYEAERSSINREKEEMANREEEMQAVIRRLKDSLSQRHGSGPSGSGSGPGSVTAAASGDDESHSSRQDLDTPSASSSSMGGGDGFAPPSSLTRSDSRNNSKLVLQKDKLIESLRLELAEAQIKLVESENQGGGRMQEVERQLMEARMANARLMEDNESYQLLLQERTLAGDFGKSDFSYMGLGSGAGAGSSSGGPASSNQDALSALEGRIRSRSNSVGAAEGAAADGAAAAKPSSLADELSDAAEADTESYRRLEAELKSARETNKALTLYINKIIERLLSHQSFERILDTSGDSAPDGEAAVATGIGKPDTNKDLPPPPAPPLPPTPPQTSVTSLLQRAKALATGGSSSAGGGGSGDSSGPVAVASANIAAATAAAAPIAAGIKIRPRPMSFMPTGSHQHQHQYQYQQPQESAHTDPDRAPSIPIGNFTRSSSVRRTRPMSEQYTSGAASIVSQMYHGGGPSSPPLGPARAQTFFAPSGMGGNPNAAARHPSGPGHAHSSSAGTGQSAAGNFPGMRGSDASSTTSADSSTTGDVATPSSPSHSPPRAPSEKSTTIAGNKPRPLRLVQDYTDSVKAEVASKRSSWMPWSWGAAGSAKKDDIPTDPIRE